MEGKGLMRRIAIVATAAFLTVVGVGSVFAEGRVIGMTSAESVTLDNSKVSGSATVFDGSTIKTVNFSRIQLQSGTRVGLGAGSSAQVFDNHVSLNNGMTEI